MKELFSLEIYPFTVITSPLRGEATEKGRVASSKKEITIQTDQYLVISSSKTYVFEDKMTKY